MAIEVNHMFPDITDSSSDLNKANDILHDATINQLGLMRRGRFDDLQGREGIDLLDTFASHPNYLDLLRLARCDVGNYEDEHVLKQQLSGALFEELALAQLGSRQDLAGVVVSGAELFNAMVALNQGREIIENGFGQTGIYGRYIPDALLMREVNGRLSVQGIIEISLGKWSKKVTRDRQIRGYHFLLNDLGIDNPKAAPFTIVTPRFEAPDEGFNRFEHLTIPVQKRVFLNELFDYAYNFDKRTGGVPLNQARQNFRDSRLTVANLASV